MHQPLISVIVPCYNYAHYITETIRSLQAQTYAHWECVVVNDGSSDNSEEVVLALAAKEPRIKYIYQENKGLPGARNTGIANASGELLQFLDADDLLQPRKFELQVKCFVENPGTDIVYGSVRYFFNENPTKLVYSMDGFNRPWSLTKSGSGKKILQYMIIHCGILVNMPLLKKPSVLEKVGPFSEDLRSCEDWEFWTRCCMADLVFRYLEVPGTHALVRAHDGSMTKNRNTMLTSMLEVRNRIGQRIGGQQPHRHVNKVFSALDWIELGYNKEFFDGKWKGFVFLWKKSLELKSLKVLFMGLLSLFLPFRLNIFLLKVIRSLQKRLYYGLLG